MSIFFEISHHDICSDVPLSFKFAIVRTIPFVYRSSTFFKILDLFGIRKTFCRVSFFVQSVSMNVDMKMILPSIFSGLA